MKTTSTTVIAVAAAAFALAAISQASASPPYRYGGPRPGPVVSTCATGFSVTSSEGSPSGAHAFTCKTPVIQCPGAPAGLMVSMGGQANPAGSGYQFVYSCRYDPPAQ